MSGVWGCGMGGVFVYTSVTRAVKVRLEDYMCSSGHVVSGVSFDSCM